MKHDIVAPRGGKRSVGKGISVNEAQRAVREVAKLMPTERIKLGRALNRILAQPVAATRDQPPFDASAMDGYAVGDGNGPFTVIGESVAGRRFEGRLGADQAVRIFTGAALPTGLTTTSLGFWPS